MWHITVALALYSVPWFSDTKKGDYGWSTKVEHFLSYILFVHFPLCSAEKWIWADCLKKLGLG